MEALLSQFSQLADEACREKSFDPSRIEELIKLFEKEAYNSWAAMEAGANKEGEDAEISMREAEAYLNSLMDSATEDFESFSREMDRRSEAELVKLVATAEAAKNSTESLGKAMSAAAKKYTDAALLSASAKKTSKGSGGGGSSKVHPSSS